MAKKKKKGLLPKRIAGVKVPKSVRNGRLGELLASRAGQALIAEAVMAAGAVVAAKKAKDSPKVRNLASYAADRVQHAAAGQGRDMGAAGSALAVALGEAARSFVDALNRRGETPPPLHADDGDGDDRVWTAGDDVEDDASKKKPISYEAGPV
jgi:NAD+--asparagine ADP-ribosyltransferase